MSTCTCTYIRVHVHVHVYKYMSILYDYKTVENPKNR